jgi:hypothetical protein
MPNIEYDFEHIRFPLTRREAKGFSFELDVMSLLSSIGYGYEGTPIDPLKWKHENGRYRVDITMDNGVKLECKNIDGKVYKSWYVRNWKSKGSCVFVYRGDLKLSPSIRELYHPVVFHYFLLPIYLNYELPLFRGVTSLYEAIRYEAVRYRYEARRYKDDKSAELKVCSKKVEDQRCSFRDRLRWKIREVLENLKYRISRFLNSSIDGKPEPKHPETRTFHYKGWETCTVS